MEISRGFPVIKKSSFESRYTVVRPMFFKRVGELSKIAMTTRTGSRCLCALHPVFYFFFLTGRMTNVIRTLICPVVITGVSSERRKIDAVLSDTICGTLDNTSD